jgi:hypothetical protein
MEDAATAREKMAEKLELAGRIYEARGGEAIKDVIKLCNFLINEVREDSDVIPSDLLLFNQGKIAALKMIVQAATTGLRREKNN